MPVIDQIRETVETQPLSHAGGLLHCRHEGLDTRGSKTAARVGDDVATQGARKLGTLAIVTAVSVVLANVVKHVLQLELNAAHHTPLFWFSTALLLLTSIGLAVLQRSGWVRPQVLLDLGLLFEILGAVGLALMENALPWPDSPIRGSTFVAAWIAVCMVLIPNRPWKSCAAAVISAAIVPSAHLLAASIVGYPPMSWNRLASYTLGPVFIAAWAPFISTRLHEMQTQLSLSQDLGSYRLDKLLGRGGMGEVWRARHRLLRREAAVKLVIPRMLSQMSPNARRHIQQRFETEAQAIATLRSPHTVSLYDFGVSDDGSLYYVMELLNGMDADDLVTQYGSLPASRVVALLRQACESLEEAHGLGMVHRDVKPSNVFVCRLGGQADFVKLLDFGLVKALRPAGSVQLTMQGETSGTPAFMAPEQVRSEPDIDGRADIYSLGCVAYYLLTGTLVFDESTPMAMAIAQVEKQPEPPSLRSEVPIPPSLERIVMSCLQKRPQDRPQSVAELAERLEECTDIPQWTRADANHWWNLHRPDSAAGMRA